jgi:hypothetical protein
MWHLRKCRAGKPSVPPLAVFLVHATSNSPLLDRRMPHNTFIRTIRRRLPGTVRSVWPGIRHEDSQCHRHSRCGDSGVRAGFVWRHENVGLVADLGFHKYSDRTGSTSLAPLMVGLRVYSDEHYRTSFFGEGLAGAYRWTVNSGDVHFTTGKGIVLGGGGMDIRLTRRLVWRVFEFQIGIAGARNGPLSTGGPSTGIAYRFGGR